MSSRRMAQMGLQIGDQSLQMVQAASQLPPPPLGSAGTYEVRAYAPGNEAPVASVSFTVTAPPDPTQEPTAEPTQEPTTAPTQEPTAEPTLVPTATEPP